MCEAHWQLDMIARKEARKERERAYRRSQPFDLSEWTARQRGIVGHMVQRVERDHADLDAFADLVRLVDEMEKALGVIARQLHDNAGYSYTDFGNATGVSRQAARQRWGRTAA